MYACMHAQGVIQDFEVEEAARASYRGTENLHSCTSCMTACECLQLAIFGIEITVTFFNFQGAKYSWLSNI